FHNRREETADLDPRGSAVTEVVQTVSVVQVIDGAGATLSVQTVVGASQTDLVDGETGSTIAVNYKAAVTTSSDADATTASVSAVSSVDPVSVTDSSTTTSSTDSESTTTTPAALSLTHISTSVPVSTFSTLSSTSNSTTTSLTSSFASPSPLSSLPSTSSPSNSSSISSTDPASFTPSQSYLSGSFSSDVASTTFASSTISSASIPFSSSTTLSGDPSSTSWLSSSDSGSVATSTGGAGGFGATSTAGGTPSSSADSGSSSNTSVQTGKVAGGIVGGIAGIALLVGLAFMILRMKKRGWCHLRLGSGEDEPDAAARKALPAPSGGGGGGAAGTEGSSAYGTMQQRSAPQAVAASLAALAGKRSSRERAGSGPEMAERGFVRVSGKKLPPVLQYGGDGYSDPRENRASHMSDASASVYRDSIAVFDQPNHQRLALGSPMRPESGIMTMHPGPARTPVTGQVPKAIDSPTLPRSSTFPSSDPLGRTLDSEGFSRDAIGRTLAAHDHSRDGAASRGSHNSRGSTRFTEHVT
ncbi:hypothetical protein N0V82_010571, partial [Gnomoniopsis sp. IMI 355080]